MRLGAKNEWFVTDAFLQKWRVSIAPTAERVHAERTSRWDQPNNPLSHIISHAFNDSGARHDEVASDLLSMYDALTGARWHRGMPRPTNDPQQRLRGFKPELSRILYAALEAGVLAFEREEIPWPFPDKDDTPSDKPPPPKPVEDKPIVSISGETGKPAGCKFVPKGKTHKYKAIGSPVGGTYQWSVGGGVSILGPSANDTVEIQGHTLSSALDDSKVTVEYTAPTGTATATTTLTVFEIQKVSAKLRATPCLRDGSRADAMPAKASTKDDKTFDAQTISVVRRAGDLKLLGATKPAGVPLSWQVERAADDDASLSGTPVLTQDGSPEKQKLALDAVGSFHVHAFVDCDGDGARGPDEAGIIFNLNLVDVEVVRGAANTRIVTNSTLFNATSSTPAFLVVHSGSTGGHAPGTNTAYGDGVFNNHAFAIKATVTVRGGGADQRRGVAKIGLGYIQQTPADSIAGTYADGRTLKEVIAQSAATPDPIVGGTPAMLAFPVRDHAGADVHGAGVFINSSSDQERSNLAAGGQRRVVRVVDSPAIALRVTHPVTNSALTSIGGSNDFAIFLTAFSKDYDENFAIVARTTWSATYGTFSGGAGWTIAGATVNAGALTVHHPLRRGEGAGVERCPPGFTTNLRMDAR